MKFFTRFALLSALLLGSLSSAFAINVVVQVGGANGSNIYSPANLTIRQGDVVVFTWVSGTHPTASDSSPEAWPIFVPGSGTPTTRIANLPVGVYPYHCTVHGGMVGSITVTAATATLDPNLATALSVYPNPSYGQVTVQFTQRANADYKLRLSNIIGQEVRTVALRPDLTATGLALDLSDLRTGVYFYSLVVDGKIISTKRLVLQN